MRKTFRPWFLIDILCVIGFALGILLFALIGKPYKRGFFCNDESIKKPYKDSTISSALAVAVGAAVSLVVIIITELTLKHQRKGQYATSESTKCFSYNIPKTITTIIWFIYVDIYGAALNTFITDVGKYSLGRLRPHFFNACKPAWGTFNCTDGMGRNVFVTADVCTAPASKITKEMRLSFPSGHSSFSAYIMVFLVLYIESRVHLPKESKFLKMLIQAVLVLLALYTGFSRVSDYKHHWSDVLAGFFLGTMVAFVIVFKVSQLKFGGANNTDTPDVSVSLSEAAGGKMMSNEMDIEAS